MGRIGPERPGYAAWAKVALPYPKQFRRRVRQVARRAQPQAAELSSFRAQSVHEPDQLVAGELNLFCKHLQLLGCFGAGNLALEGQCARHQLKSSKFLADGVM